MSNLKDRLSAFENKYAQDQEKLFRLESRASKRLGLWAAQEMGLTGHEAEDYAFSIVSHNLKEPGLGDVIEKLTTDLNQAGQDPAPIADLLNTYLLEAEAELQIS